jgi:diacylglycerol O-acyltransferase / wax synthase
MKRIKSAVAGATLNDAVLTVVGGALRTYLGDKAELPDQSLRAMVPISVRAPDQAGTAGNQVAVMIAELGTDIADPRERLHTVRTSTQQSKALSEAIGARTMTEMSEVVPGGLAALGARAASRFGMATRTAPLVNCVVSNVPGPQVPLYFAGARLEFFFGGAAVADGLGLLHGVSSYCGEMLLSAVSDREMMPDPGAYADCLDAAFADLDAAVS